MSKDHEPCHEFIENLKHILDYEDSKVRYSVRLNLVKDLIDREMERLRNE